MPFEKKVLVAVDGSEASEEALDQAVALARQGHVILTGIFVIDAGWPDYIGNDWQSTKGARQGFLDYIRAEQEAQAEAARAQFARSTHGLEPVEFAVRVGDPIEALVKIANDAAIDLLIVSRRAFQVSGRPSLKSLAVKLAKSATRPVLLLP